MALKGTTRIELTDVKTGKTEVIEKENLVTNAVPDLLAMNPNGYLWEAGSTFKSAMIPICPNAIGGILLYENPLEEDPAKYYAPDTNPLIGYSSNNVNPGADTKRGSMNQTESGPLETNDGYRFVFDFATTQGNGTISAVGLTSKQGGVSGYGSMQAYNSAVLPLVENREQATPAATYRAESVNHRYEAIAGLSEDGLYGLSVRIAGQNLVEICKVRVALEKMPLLVNVSAQANAIKEIQVLETTNFGSLAVTKGGTRSVNFLDDGEGHIWGFEHSGGAAGNSSGDATISWIKIAKADLSFVEGTWTIAAALAQLGVRPNELAAVNTVALTCQYSIIHNGFLYCLKYDLTSVVKIELANPTNVKEIPYPNGKVVIADTHDYGESAATTFNVIGDVVYFPNGHIINDEIVPASYYLVNQGGNYTNNQKWPKGLASGTIGIKQGPYMIQYLGYTATSGGTFKCYRNVSLMTPYLATINNLPSPVQKTADKTMKITYILREE